MTQDARASGYRKLAGAALVVAGLLANVWVLGWLFSPDGSIDGEQRIVLIVFLQVLCVLAGAALLWTRPPRFVKAWFPHWAVAAVAVVAVAAAAVGAGWGIWAYNTAHHHTHSGGSGEPPTAEQRAWADDFVQRSMDSAVRHGWFDFETGLADGFELQWGDRAHYVKREYLFDDKILDPDRPEFLMYRTTPRGKVLMGIMYYARTPEERGPEPGGPLALWHFHPWTGRGYCAERGLLVVSRPNDKGECAVGVRVTRSAEMLHVWFVEHPLGPFADAMLFPDSGSGLKITHLHPVVVHFTVALIAVAVLLDLLGWLTGRRALHSAATANMILAALSGVVTVAAGMTAEVNLLVTHDVHAVLDTHKLLGYTGFGGLLLLAVWRGAAGWQFPARAGIVHLAAAAATAGVVLGAGYVGAQLVYDHGLAVDAISRIALERLEQKIFDGPNPLAKGAAPVAPPDHDAHQHGGH